MSLRSTVGLVAGVGLIALGVSGFLFSQLNQLKDDLSSTQDALLSTQGDLADQKDNTLAAQEQASDLSDALDETREELSATQQQASDLSDALNETRGELAVTQQQASDLGDALDETRYELVDTEQQVSDLHGEIEDLEYQRDLANARYELLEREVGNVVEVHDEIEELKQELDELKEQRKALIPDTSTRGFTCTGSMEPAITCLDSATWLENFKPEEITVGAVISFPRSACPTVRPEGNNIGHRVADIKQVGGAYLFWPRGDNNEEADECWVKAEKVKGYIIELHKDTRPERADIRDGVNNARAAWLKARDRIRDLREAKGCHRSRGTCSFTPGPEWETARRAWHASMKAHELYWDCWMPFARDPDTYRPVVKPAPLCSTARPSGADGAFT